MPPLTNRKKFKSPEVEEYMLGKWFKEWGGIQPAEKGRWRVKVVANAQDKRDFDTFSGFRLEKIEGTKNHYSIRIGGQWRCFFFEKIIKLGKLKLVSMITKKVRR